MYLHRINRAGRFGFPSIALTLFDREEDEHHFWDIIEHYQMKDKVEKLEGGVKQLGELLDSLNIELF